MKKLFGMAIVALVLAGQVVVADDTAAKPATGTPDTLTQKATEVCNAKKLTGDALKKCIDDEVVKLKAGQK